jgi:hypothetical protein
VPADRVVPWDHRRGGHRATADLNGVAGPPTDDEERASAVFDALLEAIGAPPLGPDERAAVLRLAKVVADASQRRFAPLSCYAAGIVAGADDDADDRSTRLARLAAILDQAEAIAAGGADG